MTIKNKGTEKKFIVDTGSQFTIIPPFEEVLKDITDNKKNQGVIKNQVIFTGKITIEAESKEKRKNLPFLTT